MRPAQIELTGEGFAIVSGNNVDVVSIGAISHIIAYKIDELTTDLVCWDVVTGAGDGDSTYTLHEDMTGFDALALRLEALAGFDTTWREAVIPPPFAGSRTTIFRRAEGCI